MNACLKTLPQSEWQRALLAHQERVMPWVNDRRTRGAQNKKHPVYDFLFDYYSFRPSQLLRWSPGINLMLEHAHINSFSGANEFQSLPCGLILRAEQFPAHRVRYLNWAINYLRSTSQRAANFSCFGLHEWAMVYRSEQPRHASVPLRLSAEEIAQCCESLGIRCSHYDAFRFFTAPAKPLNSLSLARETTTEKDQPGCIHVIMDLYRFSYKIAPFISSNLVADTFSLAARAREIDMRASPYDLQEFGFAPIKIEEITGRAEYIAYQKELFQSSIPLRSRLIEEYTALQSAIEGTTPHSSIESNFSVSH